MEAAVTLSASGEAAHPKMQRNQRALGSARRVLGPRESQAEDKPSQLQSYHVAKLAKLSHCRHLAKPPHSKMQRNQCSRLGTTIAKSKRDTHLGKEVYHERGLLSSTDKI
jgi:hypothetical protein